MVKRRHRHLSLIYAAVKELVADHRQRVSQHRRHMAVLLNVFRVAVAHQRPAVDEPHPADIGKKVIVVLFHRISPHNVSPSHAVIVTSRT